MHQSGDGSCEQEAFCDLENLHLSDSWSISSLGKHSVNCDFVRGTFNMRFVKLCFVLLTDNATKYRNSLKVDRV